MTECCTAGKYTLKTSHKKVGIHQAKLNGLDGDGGYGVLLQEPQNRFNLLGGISDLAA